MPSQRSFYRWQQGSRRWFAAAHPLLHLRVPATTAPPLRCVVNTPTLVNHIPSHLLSRAVTHTPIRHSRTSSPSATALHHHHHSPAPPPNIDMCHAGKGAYRGAVRSPRDNSSHEPPPIPHQGHRHGTGDRTGIGTLRSFVYRLSTQRTGIARRVHDG